MIAQIMFALLQRIGQPWLHTPAGGYGARGMAVDPK